MSILFKGMPMPKNCNTCPLSCSRSLVYIGKGEERNANCPLVEVPPHGRLIDAGDAVITLKANKRENEAKGYILAADEDEIVRWIDKLPTIIEAEEGEKEEHGMEEFMQGQDLGDPEDGRL